MQQSHAKTLVSYLHAAVDRGTGITFIESREHQEYLSYGDLLDAATCLLGRLQAHGARPKDEIVFQINGNRDFLVAFWACLLGGMIPVPLAVGANDEHRRKVFLVWKTLNSPFLLVDSEKVGASLESYALAEGEEALFRKMEERTVVLAKGDEVSLQATLHEPGPDDIALIQFSSGSTGQPKGVTVTHRSAVVNTNDMIARLCVTDRDRYLSWMPLTHDFGIIGMHLTPLVAGIDQFQIPTNLFIRNPMLWLHSANEHRATMVASPNFGYRHFLKFFRPDAAGNWDLSCIRLIQNGAEPISPTLCHEFLDTLAPYGLVRETMLPGYGLAEATLAVSYSLFEEVVPTITLDRNRLGLGESIHHVDHSDPNAVQFVDVGYAVDSMEVRITDGNGTKLKDGVIGLIEIRGESVTRGYYNNPEATARTISSDGWLNTGDLGFMREGRIVITGRAKDIIFVGGINYYPHDIERIATELEEIDVNKIAVCGTRNDSQEREDVAAFIYFKRPIEEFPPLAEKVRNHILQKVGIALDHVVPVTAIPKTTSGKVQRYALAEALRKAEFDEVLRRLEDLRRSKDQEQRSTTRASLFDNSREEIRRHLRSVAREITGTTVDDDTIPFADLGFDSVRGIEYRNRLTNLFGVDFPISLIFDYPNVRTLGDYVAVQLVQAEGNDRKKAEAREDGSGDEIAIVGIGCRFPGDVDSYSDLVRLLGEGGETVGAAPSWRWNEANGKRAWSGSFVNDVERFDNILFSITPNEAEALDPQQRLLLETTWRAIEDANILPERLRDERTGVFIGISANEYGRRWENDPANASQYSLTGTMTSTAAGRISYTLGLNGPSMAVDTACSSSLVALHLAVQSLRRGESDCALAGGVNLILDSTGFEALTRIGALSPDGRCKAFGESADGYGRGEGCGIVLLKRLADAERDGDSVYAVIAGSAVNHDGRSNGLTAPNGLAQERVVRDALADADVATERIGYLEAHGTGTALGDPQEINALQNVFGRGLRERKVVVGSVKSNLGHLESAAGIAGVLKAVAALREGRFYQSLHCERPSPYIEWNAIGLEVAGESRAWESEKERFAGVSAFGLSGTNAHLILREYRSRESARPALDNSDEAPFLLPLSAAHPDALAGMIDRYGSSLRSYEGSLRDLCGTAAHRRTHLRYREAVVGSTIEELVAGFTKSKEERSVPINAKGLAWIFTGQGSQYRGMGRALYETNAIFREAVDRCSSLFAKWLGYSVRDLIYGQEEREIDETIYAQPTIFTIEYALARVWLSFGTRPDIVGGHSIGEFAAACVAEVFSLEDAVMLVAHRAIYMQELEERGGMIAAFCSEQQVKTAINGDPVAVAAVNGPQSVVMAGKREALEHLVRKLKDRGIATRALKVSHAFHSPLMAPAVERFREVASRVSYRPPAIPFVSSMTGETITSHNVPNADYWTDHILSTVRFADAVTEAVGQGARTFLEIGSTSTLCSLGAAQTDASETVWIPSMLRDRDDRRSLLDAVASLYRRGFEVDWNFIYPEGSYQAIPLPSYPFLRNRFWLEGRRATDHTIETHANPQLANPMNGYNGTDRNGKDSSSARTEVLHFLLHVIEEKTGARTSDLPIDRDLFEIGLDSLVLIGLRQKIEGEFGVEIPHSLLYDNATIEKIADYVAKHLPAKEHAEVAGRMNGHANGAAQGIHSNGHSTNGHGTHHGPVASTVTAESVGTVEAIINRQLEVMSEQLRLLQGMSTPVVSMSQPGHSSGSGNGVIHNGRNGQEHRNETHGTGGGVSKGVPAPKKEAFVPYRKIVTTDDGEVAANKRRYLDGLIERYCTLTRSSKDRTELYRPVFANNRNVAGFRPKWKELIYQLQVERAEGSKVYDVDGNEYIDLTMGFGVNLFGHNPGFVRAALDKALENGPSVGPMSPLAGSVSKRLAELTGIERASYYNSGTEAIMVALRLARAATGRSKVVIFSGSYHGSFDGILAVPGSGDALSAPLAPGVPQSLVDDIIVLPYAVDESLHFIRAYADSLAAVLVETVQSRRPDVQPAEFLHELRRITESSGAALIFDEVITGFRIHPGGAQHHFGIRADLSVYGKVVGGGMPIGIVAGKARFMDGVDGGQWSFGDDSVPTKQNTFTAGTFCHHPLAMAATEATLDVLAEKGEEICKGLNARTAWFADSLNTFFRNVNVPLRIVHFGSLFRFDLSGDWELLYFALLTKGVYIWEGRNCFFSTAHSDEEIDAIRIAVIESVLEMIDGGFSPDTTLPGDRSSLLLPPSSLSDLSPSSLRLDMSSVQRRIYALSQTPDGELAYHITSGVILEGEIDANRIERSFRTIIDRHEGLRTGFLVEDEEFLQEIHPAVDFALERGDRIDDTTDNAIDRAFHRFVRPFDLSRPPLMRLGLLPMASGRHLLLLDVHHIVADGISLTVIFDEFARLYGGQRLVPVRTQYRETLGWEDGFRKSDEFASQEGFWKELLAGETESLTLPVDRERKGSENFDGGCVYREFPAEEVRRIARENGCSVYMVLLAAYGGLLQRVGGAKDFRIGIVHAGRSEERFATTVGMFANSLLFPCSVDPEKSFVDLLGETKKKTLAIYANYDFPFERIAELDRRAVADQRISFSYERGFGRSLNVGDATGMEYFHSRARSISDFALDVVEEADVLRFRFDYSADLFDKSTVERLAGYFARFLNDCVATPHASIGDLNLVSDEERRVLLSNYTECPSLETLPDGVTLFERWAAETPDATALLFENGSMSYADLNRFANGVASRLLKEGEPITNRMVALVLERSPEFVAAILGILKAGGGFLPIDPSLPDARIEFMLADAGISTVLTSRKFAEHPALQGYEIVEMSTVDRGVETNPNVRIDFGSVAYMIYTSGSTGQPKGVMVSHGNLANYAYWTADIRINRNDVQVVSLHTTPSFDMIIGQFMPALLTGKSLYLHNPSLTIDQIMERVFSPDTPIDCAVLTPSHALLLEDLPLTSSNVKVASIGGEALGTHHTAILWGLNPEMQIINDYGPTEATVTCIIHHVNEDGRVSIVGKPTPGASAYILDDRLQPCPIGVIGEICVGGDCVALGYRNRPELTESRFIANPFVTGDRLYRTGDLGRLLPDGTIEFFGRKDRQVKLFGNRIELDEVEAAICASSDVKAAAVKLVEAEGRKLLAAYVATAEEIDVDELRKSLAARLPHYMVPSVFVRVEKLPLTPNGKINFAALPDPEIKASEENDRELPRTKEEGDVAAAWESVLGIDRVGIRDNFYEVGGDSIKAIRIASRLRKNGYSLDAAAIMRNSTVEGIARHIAAETVRIAQEPVEGNVPLTPIQHWFFGRAIPNPHHWNQEVVLRSTGRLNEESVRAALRSLVHHHDGLRISFRTTKNAIEAYNRPIGEGKEFALEIADLPESADLVRDAVNRAHESLHIENGPLLGATLLTSESESILALAIHHLVVDAVSWDVIIDDFIAAYGMAERSESISLPSKTHSVRDYAEALHRYAETDELVAEIPYWEEIERKGENLNRLPADMTPSNNTEAQTAIATISLDRENTELLLSEANRPYSTTTRELLAATLAITLSEWTGGKNHLLLLEGHGRESIGGMAVDRTVGWFTSTYPVVIAAEEKLEETILNTKETIRRVPRNGIGYGVLHYLTSSEKRGSLRFDLPTEVLFNYLGDLDFNLDVDQKEDGGRNFRVGIDPIGSTTRSDAPRDERIGIDAFVRGGELHWTIFYNCEEYKRETIEKLCASLRDRLAELVRHCLVASRALSPSDLDYRGFGKLNELAAFLQSNDLPAGAIETIRPLVPMQEGMLFHHLTDSTGTSGLAQLGLSLRGRLDADLLEKAFSHVVRRYDTLRTGFAWKGWPEPLSIVYRDVRADYRLVENGEAGHNRTREELLVSDWSEGFDLSGTSQTRMTLLREADDRHTLVWTTHHIVSDGWCIGLVFTALLEAYDAYRAGGEPDDSVAPSYSLYLRWLETYDATGSLNFWKEYLKGYEATASLPQSKMEGIDSVQRNWSLHLEEKTIANLQSVASAERTTTNALVRAAWSLVLSHYAGRGDVLYGAVVSGRPAAIEDVESIVGLFINTIPVRFRVDADSTFDALVRNATDDALRCEPYHYTGLAEVQGLTPLKEKLFDHILVFENYPLDQEIARGLKNRDDFSIERVDFKGDESFDLVLTVMLDHEREILFTYDAGRYDEQTIRDAAEMLNRILIRIIEYPGATISEIVSATAPKNPAKEESKKKSPRSLNSLKGTQATKVSLR